MLCSSSSTSSDMVTNLPYKCQVCIFDTFNGAVALGISVHISEGGKDTHGVDKLLIDLMVDRNVPQWSLKFNCSRHSTAATRITAQQQRPSHRHASHVSTQRTHQARSKKKGKVSVPKVEMVRRTQDKHALHVLKVLQMMVRVRSRRSRIAAFR